MALQRVFGAAVPLERRILFTTLGIICAFVDVFVEPYIAIDLAWITVLLCGLPIAIHSIYSVVDRLEINSNFLTTVALIALVAIGDYHDAAYISILFQLSIIVEQYVTPSHLLTVNDNWMPTMGVTYHEINDHMTPWAPVMVIATIFCAIGSYAVTQDLVHTITLLLVICPALLASIVSLYQMTHLVSNAPHVANLTNRDKYMVLFGSLASICLYGFTIVGAAVGFLTPVTAVIYFAIGRLVSLGTVTVVNHSSVRV